MKKLNDSGKISKVDLALINNLSKYRRKQQEKKQKSIDIAKKNKFNIWFDEYKDMIDNLYDDIVKSIERNDILLNKSYEKIYDEFIEFIYKNTDLSHLKF